MTILSTFGGASGVDTGDIPASLRFRSAASARLARTPSAAPTRRQVTFSFWFKRGTLGAAMRLFQTRDNGGSSANAFGIYLNAANDLDVYQYSSAYTLLFRTSAVFRDPTSWNHLVVAIDTTQATSADRVKLYLNGVSLTSSTYTAPALNLDLYWDSAVQHNIGCFDSTGSYSTFFDGEFARIAVVSQQQLTPADFGYQNTEINEWVSKSQSAVKAVVDAGGTNSFMLDFDDGTSTTTLGYDKSSKGNNWTLNNVSLTAGSTYDWMLDVPGNSYATLNPIYPSAASITNANLTSSTTAVRATMNALLFDCKWEVTAGGSAVTAGVISATGTTNTTSVTANKTFAFRLTTAGALDYKNVTDAGSWTSITTGLSGEQYPYGVTQAANWNFGQAPLHASATYQSAAGGYFYDTTTGFKALCQRNMPDPAILNPEKHFDVVTYTGTAATKSITGLLFSPGLVEMKSRGRALDWAYYDSVRGVEKRLESNNTDAEVTGDTTGLTAFNSDGWTMGALDQINGTTATNSFVGSAWKAGGAAVTNNAGSISSQVSANVDAGFSIVTYTGTGANATVGHGLGKAPGLVIVKKRAGGTFGTGYSDWCCYHANQNAAPASGATFLNLTNAFTASSLYFNSTAPSTTAFSIGTSFYTGNASNDYVAYCFAEIPGFSKIFSYTGNGSADGPFVQCGFKPKFILVKRTDSSTYGNWEIIDTVRDTYNQSFNDLIANLSNAENVDGASWDILSNGFKCRDGSSTGNKNVSGGTYIGIAFADVAGKFALGR